MKLTQKETTLLQDLMSHEQLCIDKYTKYSSEAKDNELKNLFSTIGQMENQHLKTLQEIQQGKAPNMNQGGGSKPKLPASFTATYTAECPDKAQDKYLCSDLLSTEKHVSSVYDTSIFEFVNPAFRDALNHIEKEEQEHGYKLFQYMDTNGMYKVQQ